MFLFFLLYDETLALLPIPSVGPPAQQQCLKTHNEISSKLCNLFQSCGLTPEHYSTHSLRSGTATTAALHHPCLPCCVRLHKKEYWLSKISSCCTLDALICSLRRLMTSWLIQWFATPVLRHLLPSCPPWERDPSHVALFQVSTIFPCSRFLVVFPFSCWVLRTEAVAPRKTLWDESCFVNMGYTSKKVDWIICMCFAAKWCIPGGLLGLKGSIVVKFFCCPCACRKSKFTRYIPWQPGFL